MYKRATRVSVRSKPSGRNNLGPTAPGWDNTVADHAQFRLSEEDSERRKEARVSPNKSKAQSEYRQRLHEMQRKTMGYSDEDFSPSEPLDPVDLTRMELHQVLDTIQRDLGDNELDEEEEEEKPQIVEEEEEEEEIEVIHEPIEASEDIGEDIGSPSNVIRTVESLVRRLRVTEEAIAGEVKLRGDAQQLARDAQETAERLENRCEELEKENETLKSRVEFLESALNGPSAIGPVAPPDGFDWGFKTTIPIPRTRIPNPTTPHPTVTTSPRRLLHPIESTDVVHATDKEEEEEARVEEEEEEEEEWPRTPSQPARARVPPSYQPALPPSPYHNTPSIDFSPVTENKGRLMPELLAAWNATLPPSYTRVEPDSRHALSRQLEERLRSAASATHVLLEKEDV